MTASPLTLRSFTGQGGCAGATMHGHRSQIVSLSVRIESTECHPGIFIELFWLFFVWARQGFVSVEGDRQPPFPVPQAAGESAPPQLFWCPPPLPVQ